jgi:hypothetical protein
VDTLTPGPWEIEHPYGEPGTYISGPLTELVARVYTNDADARLIAQAPAMFAALCECITVYEQHRDAQPTGHLWPDPNHIYHARAAVTAATTQEAAV